jgi:hypothetical protein
VPVRGYAQSAVFLERDEDGVPLNEGGFPIVQQLGYFKAVFEHASFPFSVTVRSRHWTPTLTRLSPFDPRLAQFAFGQAHNVLMNKEAKKEKRL